MYVTLSAIAATLAIALGIVLVVLPLISEHWKKEKVNDKEKQPPKQ